MEIELVPEDLIATLEGSVERLKVIQSTNNGVALSDGVSELLQLCTSVEAILRHMQKDKSSFWGDRRDYWHYLSEGVSQLKTLDTLTRRVQAQQQFTTGQGRGRALIRECLCEGLLADCIQTAVSNKKRTKEWYHTSSIMLSPTLSQRVLTALYDLSSVTFDLQSEGIDLDETWPSFVLKSFDGTSGRSLVTDHTPPPKKAGLFGVLSSGTQEAKVATNNRSTPNRAMLERAVEEVATEIFVRHEVPFNLPLVGSLLAEIRSNLIGQCDHDHMINLRNALPELKVEKMDDITSCLTVLSEYLVSWSRELRQFNTSTQTELKLIKDKLADVELQLEDTLVQSESSETHLLSQIQSSRNDLQSCEGEAFQLGAQIESLNNENRELRNKVSELENMNFDLEEQLIANSETSSEETTKELTRTKDALSKAQNELEMLKQELLSTKEDLQNSVSTHELLELTQGELTDLSVELEQTKSEKCSLVEKVAELKELKSKLDLDAQKLKSDFESEIADMRSKRDSESQKYQVVLAERDQAKSELESMQGLVDSQTTSLKFQLSTQAIDLQRSRELCQEHEQSVREHKAKVSNLESQLGEVSERCEIAEGQINELKTELQDMEGILSTSRTELSSVTEQLVEKTVSQELERSQTLRLHTEVEVLSTRLTSQKDDLKKQITEVKTENEDLKKAFKKLLQQKVTLWQHADKLEQEQVAKGKWINDKTVTECMGCGMTFSVFNRKHHCRSCGKVYCTPCCEKKAQLPFSKDPVRVCEQCFDKIQDVRTPMSSKMVNTLDMESIMVATKSLGVKAGGQEESTAAEGGSGEESSNSLNIARNIEVSGNSLTARLHQQNLAGSLPSIEDTTSSVSSFRDIAKYLNSSSGALDSESLHSVNSTDYMVDPELKQREADKVHRSSGEQIEIQDGSVTISTVAEGDDDGYYVIESEPQNSVFPVGLDSPGTPRLDVDALASKLASLEVTQTAGSEKAHTRKVSDSSISSGFRSPEYKEVMMEGGASHMVPIRIQKKGAAIVWEFSTEPKGIAFGLSYKESKDSTHKDEVLPLKRCSSHKTTLSGEYVSQKPGVYLLQFDNCHSKYTGRKLMYKVFTRQPL